jgi:general secretion pathway protein A
VDEAQRLSPDLLEEIRLLTNLETPQHKLLQIIIAGQPELMETIRRPEFRQLKQRVSYFCHLQALNADEVGEYITHRLKQAGLPNQTLFPQPVVHAIHEYSKGTPRIVNTLCDNALQIGCAAKSPRITVAMVREAAKDLDLLPLPQKESGPATGHAANPFATTSPEPPAGNAVTGPTESLLPQPPLPVRSIFEAYEERQKTPGLLARLVGRR